MVDNIVINEIKEKKLKRVIQIMSTYPISFTLVTSVSTSCFKKMLTFLKVYEPLKAVDILR